MSYPILRSSLSSQTCTGLRLILASHTELKHFGIPLKYLGFLLFHLSGMELIFRCDLLDRTDAFDRPKTARASKSEMWLRTVCFICLFGVLNQGPVHSLPSLWLRFTAPVGCQHSS